MLPNSKVEDMKQELKNCRDRSKKRLIRSFGRIKSRKFSPHKNFLLKNLLPLYELDCVNCDSIKNNCLEIGFGFGDFIFEKAKKNPDTLFFGFEPHLNGVVNLMAKLENEPLKNLKISRQDVRLHISDFPDKFFDDVFILFPDPWPKAKHSKRRLINLEFLDEVLSPKMKKDAKLTIATDHDTYKTWILSAALRSKQFFWSANSKKDWQNFPDDWVTTKYQKKALNEGREPIALNLINR